MIVVDNILDVEKRLEGIDAVVFDLDDTLYSEKDYVRSGYRAIAQAYPTIPTMFDELWATFEKKEPAIDVVFARYGMLSRKDEALNLYRFHKPSISLYPGVKEMLIRLKKTKKLGIITDGRPEGQRAKIEVLNLSEIVDDIIITDELGGVTYRKPCDLAFKLISKHLHISVERMCYVGDNYAKDSMAPEILGMQYIFFRNENGLYYNKGIVVGNEKDEQPKSLKQRVWSFGNT